MCEYKPRWGYTLVHSRSRIYSAHLKNLLNCQNNKQFNVRNQFRNFCTYILIVIVTKIIFNNRLGGTGIKRHSLLKIFINQLAHVKSSCTQRCQKYFLWHFANPASTFYYLIIPEIALLKKYRFLILIL